MKPHYKRHQLETFLVQEHDILQKCVKLLTQQIPFAEWSSDIRAIFLLALLDGEGKESRKAFGMARHLRLRTDLPTDDIPENPTHFQRRCSERIRADLSKFTKLGAGSYLEEETSLSKATHSSNRNRDTSPISFGTSAK